MRKIKLIELDDVDSTNEYCKRYEEPGDIIVVAERQSKGKGTKGRSFTSDSGGLYISIRRNYQNFNPENTFSIMINSCVAVCKTLERFGITPHIKWANDVLVGGKKICGTLIENTLSPLGACTSIVGIGLNINNALTEELKPIATTMSQQLNKSVPVKDVQRELIKNLGKTYTVEDYKSYIHFFGQTVKLDFYGDIKEGVALDVDEAGNLVCEIEGETKKVSSAEIKLWF